MSSRRRDFRRSRELETHWHFRVCDLAWVRNLAFGSMSAILLFVRSQLAVVLETAVVVAVASFWATVYSTKPALTS